MSAEYRVGSKHWILEELPYQTHSYISNGGCHHHRELTSPSVLTKASPGRHDYTPSFRGRNNGSGKTRNWSQAQLVSVEAGWESRL